MLNLTQQRNSGLRSTRKLTTNYEKICSFLCSNLDFNELYFEIGEINLYSH